MVQPVRSCQDPSHLLKSHSTCCYTRKASIAAQPGNEESEKHILNEWAQENKSKLIWNLQVDSLLKFLPVTLKAVLELFHSRHVPNYNTC